MVLYQVQRRGHSKRVITAGGHIYGTGMYAVESLSFKGWKRVASFPSLEEAKKYIDN